MYAHTLKYIAILFLLISISYSQWPDNWDTPGNWAGASLDVAVKLKVSGGNVFVTGNTHHPDTGFAIMTIKYNSSGVQQWKTLYKSLSKSNAVYASGIDVDDSGNVYVVGVKYTGGSGDFITIKYNSSGVEQWAATYDGGGNDRGNAIALDNLGYVYVTGGSDSAGTMNISTVKYNSAGSFQWSRMFNKGGSLSNTIGYDEAFAIALDTNSSRSGSGYGLYVVGTYDDGNNCPGDTIDGNCENDAQIIHYTFSGTLDGHLHYGCGPNNRDDMANDVVVSDETGFVYAVGKKWCQDSTHTTHGHQFMVMKCKWNSTTFAMDYAYCGRARYFNPDVDGGNNEGYSLVVQNVNDSDFVYATGRSEGDGTGFDFLTIKFNYNGSHLWVNRYNSGGSTTDFGRSIAINNANVFVTGFSGEPGSADITTIQYDTAGNQICLAIYNGSSNLEDVGVSIGVDGSSVYVAGITNENDQPNSQADFITLQYTESNCDDGDFRPLTSGLIKHYSLKQNFPNPFNPSTVIGYTIPTASYVTVNIYNILGQVVFKIPAHYKAPGEYSEIFDASNLATGVYFYEINAVDAFNPLNSFNDVKKMFLLK